MAPLPKATYITWRPCSDPDGLRRHGLGWQNDGTMTNFALIDHMHHHKKEVVGASLPNNCGTATIELVPTRYHLPNGTVRDFRMPLPVDLESRESIWGAAMAAARAGQRQPQLERILAARTWFGAHSDAALGPHNFKQIHWKSLLSDPELRRIGGGDTASVDGLLKHGREQVRRKSFNLDELRVKVDFNPAFVQVDAEQHQIACTFLDLRSADILDTELQLLDELGLQSPEELKTAPHSKLANRLRSRLAKIARLASREGVRLEALNLEAFVRYLQGESMLLAKLLEVSCPGLNESELQLYRVINQCGPRTKDDLFVPVPVVNSPALRSALMVFGGLPAPTGSGSLSALHILPDLLEILWRGHVDPNNPDELASLHKAVGLATWFPAWVFRHREQDKEAAQRRRARADHVRVVERGRAEVERSVATRLADWIPSGSE